MKSQTKKSKRAKQSAKKDENKRKTCTKNERKKMYNEKEDSTGITHIYLKGRERENKGL